MGEQHKATRRRLTRLYQQYWALLVLTSGLSHEEREAVRLSIPKVNTLPKHRLSGLLRDVGKEVDSLRDAFGITTAGNKIYDLVSPEGFRASLRGKPVWKNPLLEGTTVLFLSRFVLAEALPKFDRIFPVFSSLPPHALISVDISGAYVRPEREITLLEATLFEDMAALWNLTSTSIGKYVPNSPKRISKPIVAMNRATAKAAFNLIEGYLNGIAIDIVAAVPGLSDHEKELVREWRPGTGSPRNVSLRQKLLSYPRIAVRSQHPILDEHHCSAMARVIALEEKIRHSLIHPTPRPPRHPGDADREFEFRSLTFAEVGSLCDDVIDTIFSIDNALAGRFGSVASWLARRQPDGLFSEDVFH